MVVVYDDPPLPDSLFAGDAVGWGLEVAVVRDTGLKALASLIFRYAAHREAYLIAVRQVTADDLRAMAAGRPRSALDRTALTGSYSVTYVVEFGPGSPCGWATWPAAWVTILRDGAGFRPHAVIREWTSGGLTVVDQAAPRPVNVK
jgi:hypothetical protein